MQTPGTPWADVVAPRTLPCHDSVMAQILGLEDIVRTQNPKLEKTTGRNQKYFIRPFVDIIESGKLVRKQRRIYLGSCDAMGKREALTAKTKALETINHSQYVAQAQIPFSEFLDLFERNHMDTVRASTRQKYSSHIRTHIRPAFGNQRMADITPLAIQSWIKGKRLSSATKADLRNIIHGIFSRAEEWGYWREKNPAEHVRLGKAKAVRERRKMTTEETRALLAELSPQIRMIVEVALYCGLRISEVLGLRWKHIDLAAGVLKVEERYYRGDVDDPKTPGSQRIVALGDMAADFSLIHPGPGRDEEWVFTVPTHGGRRETRDDRIILRHFIRPQAKALGLDYDGFGFHAFRRDAITRLVREMDPFQAMRMAGHSRLDMTQHYVQTDTAAQDKAIRRVQKEMRDE